MCRGDKSVFIDLERGDSRRSVWLDLSTFAYVLYVFMADEGAGDFLDSNARDLTLHIHIELIGKCSNRKGSVWAYILLFSAITFLMIWLIKDGMCLGNRYNINVHSRSC